MHVFLIWDVVHADKVSYNGKYLDTFVCINWLVVDLYHLSFGSYISSNNYRSGTVNSKSFVGKVLLRIKRKFELTCCDMDQNDTIGKIELNPSFVLSSNNTNYKNDIQLFLQLFDELRVNRDCH